MAVLTQDFADFVEATGPTYVTGPQSLINDAQKQTYSFGDITYGDTGKKKMIQGGSDIRESIIFDDRGTFTFHHPGETRNWTNPQKLKKTKAFWRFSEDHMAWTRQELMLNDRIKHGTADARFQAYVDLRNEKEMLMWTSVWNGMEDQLWVAPTPENMEAEDGKQPFSIPAFINEDTSGLFDPQTSAAFTTIEGIDPTAAGFTKFVPVNNRYTSSDVNDPDNIISVFDDTWKDVRFEMPPTMSEYFTNPKFSKFRIFCSRRGQSIYQQLLRASQDTFVTSGRQDPAYASPLFNGIPVTWVSTLDDAALYDDGSSALKTEIAAGGDRGPRYYWVNSEFLYPVFHDQMYFEKSSPHKHHNDPDTYVCEVNTWYQVICTSRQRHAIVGPTGDIYTA